ncbi:MAG TPA: sugar ABC transporter substrate-binding protein [Streptosporangiaceae bacterium]|nr:sugar ABC transporter substrate-binding protein [Streptosporangiaceae bacterium]
MRTSRTQLTTAAIGSGLLLLAAACGSSAGNGASAAQPTKTPLTLMFGSSGPAETSAVQAAATAWTKASGIKVKVIAASNLTQQLAQGFAGGQPPDVFYLDPGSFQNYAKQNALATYPQQLPNAGAFYPALKSSFSYQGKFECEPKDASTLALYINTADWKAAGLSQADIPANWSQLQSVAKKLTTAQHTGLVLDQTHSGIDEFLYQNGGTVVGSGGKVELDSQPNIQALTYLKGLMTAGVMKFPSQVSAGWSGEAFGKNKAAMAIVGNWVVGAMQSDYPSIKYQVAPLPAGPTGTKATLAFTNCWGIPASSKNMAGAVSFVKFLTAPKQQMAFSKAFGVIPSLQSLQSQWQQAFPALAAHTEQLPVAHPDIALPGDTQALAAFDSALAQLKTSSPAAILKAAQTNLQPLAGASS